MSWAQKLERAREDPRLAIAVAMALARGQYYRLLFRLRGQRVVIGSGFQVTGRLDIRGPGTVIFGNRCQARSQAILSLMKVDAEVLCRYRAEVEGGIEKRRRADSCHIGEHDQQDGQAASSSEPERGQRP